jgi:hypothetical protein
MISFQGEGTNVIKLFKAVIYQCLQYARVFVPGKPFQPSLMFVGKGRSLPQSGAPKSYFTVSLQPYPQALD